jgi:hypothetical protein
MIVTIGYTGLRWGEAIGLERGYTHPGEIHVEWQLRELGGRFHRLPPKDDSYRSPAWEPCLPVDLPPFLTALLGRQIRDHEHPPCGCAAQHGRSGRYLFLGPDGGHYRRSNYARRVFRPACDGRHQGSQRPPRQARHRRRHHLARHPHRRLATHGPVRGLRAAARPGHPDHPR